MSKKIMYASATTKVGNKSWSTPRVNPLSLEWWPPPSRFMVMDMDYDQMHLAQNTKLVLFIYFYFYAKLVFFLR